MRRSTENSEEPEKIEKSWTSSGIPSWSADFSPPRKIGPQHSVKSQDLTSFGSPRATDHDRFDYELIKRHAPLIVDTRGRYQEPAEHIAKA